MKTDPKGKVKEYLDELAKSDEQFAAMYAKEEKNMESCWSGRNGERTKKRNGRKDCIGKIDTKRKRESISVLKLPTEE